MSQEGPVRRYHATGPNRNIVISGGNVTPFRVIGEHRLGLFDHLVLLGNALVGAAQVIKNGTENPYSFRSHRQLCRTVTCDQQWHDSNSARVTRCPIPGAVTVGCHGHSRYAGE